ncbi:bifunctional aminodeoxychorismate synthase component I/aminotransferase [Helicobacter sp. MIT 14-3879]|nr:bifunctional aminodeoxychorismate synthase component I/aminotransferase [Helicobacter sp. MIT 14-3879]
MSSDYGIFGDYLYYQKECELYAYNLSQAKETFNFIEKNKKNLFFVGYIYYEFYQYINNAALTSNEPYLFFAGFKKKKPIPKTTTKHIRFYPIFTKKLDKKLYYKNFKSIKKAIAKGKSYQANLTQKIKFQTNVSSFRLFHLLSNNQNTKFKAFLHNRYIEILSFSPELFFKTYATKDGIKITTQPMKGTIKRDKNLKKDKKNKIFLKKDSKNLSENVMIVDLLRNDLSRIIKPHTLKTSKLFSIKTYPTLHQMVSNVSGILKEKTNLMDIFIALFPCGSITGVPKKETINLLSILEQKKREIYCGAIGVIDSNKSIFSVGIRTLWRKCSEKSFNYGVGSGLIWDSNLRDEFRELKLKAKFLESSKIELFETMFIRDFKILFFKEHLERLLISAKKLGFKTKRVKKDFEGFLNINRNYAEFIGMNLESLNKKLFREKHSFFDNLKLKHKEGIAKLILHKNGDYNFCFTKIKPIKNKVLELSSKPLITDDLVFHKSTNRGVYKKESKKWQDSLCYDIAFFNEREELCEGSRSNLILQYGQKFYTPHINCAMLNGIYRQFLLNINLIEEKILFRDDLKNADKIFTINSVRGLQEVKLKKAKIKVNKIKET